ncbi:MAG: hypothetical protein PVF73_12860, partial [Bacteroidales bacterium]
MKNILILSGIRNLCFVTFAMVLSLICNTNLKAQDTDLNFSVEITDATSYTDSDGSIIIIVDGSDSRYTFMLYDKEPWQGG